MTAHRLAILWLCAALQLAACGDKDGERRRELLTPRDPELARAEKKEKRRVFDEDGDLLSSGEQVGGVLLPKGLTLHRKVDEHTFYRTNKVPFEKLDRWFGGQLISTTVERNAGAVKFGGAVPRTDLKAPRLDLYLTRLSGAPNSIEIYFRQSAPFKLGPAPDHPEAQLQRSRQFRD